MNIFFVSKLCCWENFVTPNLTIKLRLYQIFSFDDLKLYVINIIITITIKSYHLDDVDRERKKIMQKFHFKYSTFRTFSVCLCAHFTLL